MRGVQANVDAKNEISQSLASDRHNVHVRIFPASDNGDGTFLYARNAGYSGSDGFTYTVEDNQGAFGNVASVAMIVTPSFSLGPFLERLLIHHSHVFSSTVSAADDGRC